VLTQLTVKWPHQIPRKFREQTFTGSLVDSWSQDPLNTLRLKTGTPRLPECVIPRRLIVDWNEESLPEVEQQIAETKTVYIPSSDLKSIYTVTFDGARWTCDCKGFHFRASCKHLKIAEEMK